MEQQVAVEKKAENQSEMPMDRTSAGLRNALFDEIDMIRSGSSNPARARALATLANTCLKSVLVEIEYHKYVNDITNKKAGIAQLGSLELGTKPIQLS